MFDIISSRAYLIASISLGVFLVTTITYLLDGGYLCTGVYSFSKCSTTFTFLKLAVFFTPEVDSIEAKNYQYYLIWNHLIELASNMERKWLIK